MFFTTESLKTNEKICIVRQETNLNLLTLRKINYKNHTDFSTLTLLLSSDKSLNTGPTQTSETWTVLKNKGFILFIQI